jgi:rhodanese-related sulfurtransferase
MNPHDLNLRLRAPGEIAVLDVREQGAFARKHLLHAVPAPLRRLELLIDRLVPRRATPIVLTDLDGSLTSEAAALLGRLGYTDVAALEGGTLAWEAAGLEVFSGDNVLSKAFGEAVEHAHATPHIGVATLAGMMERREKFVVVDGRTPEEFCNFSLPGAASLPNGELAYRILELVPDDETTVVVNCAGRTRSIMGAQTLIEAGVRNPVVALENGTMAWLLSGRTLDHGRAAALAEPTAAHLAPVRESAAAFARRAGVRVIDAAGLGAWQQDAARSLYRFDVRSQAEYRSGHLDGWRWAPGGQLLQATDQYIGVRGARIVLADWDGVRAPMMAGWLARMGAQEVALHAPPASAPLQVGDEAWRLVPDPTLPPVPWVGADALRRQIEAGDVVVFDVDKSVPYGKRHVAGALFAAPDRVARFATERAHGRPVVLTSADGILAQRVASHLRGTGIDARALRGGNAAWFDAGLPTAGGRAEVLTGEDDAWYSAYAYEDLAVRDAKFREYLDWEIGLAAQLEKDGARPAFRLAEQESTGVGA